MNTNTLALPILFREALSAAGMQAIDEWWRAMDYPSRSDALHLWHDCQQSGGGLNVRVEARFVDEAEEDVGDFWHSDYYDYLINHEIYLFEARKFHVCTRQPAAAAAVCAGLIPHDFCCPVQSSDCPMRRLLKISPGKSLRLSVAVGRTLNHAGRT